MEYSEKHTQTQGEHAKSNSEASASAQEHSFCEATAAVPPCHANLIMYLFDEFEGKKNLDKTVQIYFSSCFVLLRYQMSLIYDYILNKSHTWRYVIRSAIKQTKVSVSCI